MAGSPWLIQTRFWVSDNSRKQIFRGIWGKCSHFLILWWKCLLFVLIRIASSRWVQWVHSTYHYFIEHRKAFLNHPHLCSDLTLWLFKPSVTRTTHVQNKFPLSQRCTSHWSSTVITNSEGPAQTYGTNCSNIAYRLRPNSNFILFRVHVLQCEMDFCTMLFIEFHGKPTFDIETRSYTISR